MSKKKSKKNIKADTKKREEIIQTFKKRRILNLLSTLIIFGIAFFAIWFSNNRASIPDENTHTAIMVAIGIVSIGALAFSFYNWRCPACGKHLGRSVDPQACMKCGYKFR